MNGSAPILSFLKLNLRNPPPALRGPTAITNPREELEMTTSFMDTINSRARQITARDFGLYAKTFLAGRGIPGEMAEFGSHIASQRLQEVLKAAVEPASVTGSTWGSQTAPYAAMVSGFVQSLIPFSAYDAMYASMVHLPLRTRVAIATTAAVGNAADSELAASP
jgi:hypothetical protein